MDTYIWKGTLISTGLISMLILGACATTNHQQSYTGYNGKQQSYKSYPVKQGNASPNSRKVITGFLDEREATKNGYPIVVNPNTLVIVPKDEVISR